MIATSLTTVDVTVLLVLFADTGSVVPALILAELLNEPVVVGLKLTVILFNDKADGEELLALARVQLTVCGPANGKPELGVHVQPVPVGVAVKAAPAGIVSVTVTVPVVPDTNVGINVQV